MKTCRHRGEQKDTSEFPVHREKRDGLSSWCRACHAEACARWRAEHPEKVDVYNERRRAEYAAMREAEHQAARKALNDKGCASRFSGTANATSGGAIGGRPRHRLRPVLASADRNGGKRGGTIMGRLLLVLGVLCAMAVPLSAQAGTTVERVTFEDEFPLCNGHLIHISGPLLLTTTDTFTPSGGHVFAFHAQPQGVRAVDLEDGTMFRAVGLTRDLVVESPAGGTTETFINRFHIQATRGAESYIITDLFHITITPDGTVRVEIEVHSEPC